ncbi:hypothetical protein EX30DRAFT_339622 [Ascodesmis nigricans]|uniref:CWH43-like N-terminal domain-containing protein n=1 Tax=Ascodesmis nigricans TaxID=341454 RepID=A0A4S2N330_9PEZI|nr:hypothetical protein EX30DRAFT_339622 [Ascodesmis nigricans]
MDNLAPPEPDLPHHRHHIPYYVLPLISAAVWIGTLWAMMIVWLAEGQPFYASMSETQSIAYISDVGADILRPLFITGCAITGIFFFLSLCATRSNHDLLRRKERVLDWASIISALVGAVSLIMLAVMDTLRHPDWHRGWLLFFMLGVVLSALFTTIEYRFLGKTFRQTKIIYLSYRFKQFIVIVEVALSISFGACMYKKKHNAGAIIEWLIAFLFTFYVLSFFFDLRPRASTKGIMTPEELHELRERQRQTRRPGIQRFFPQRRDVDPGQGGTVNGGV